MVSLGSAAQRSNSEDPLLEVLFAQHLMHDCCVVVIHRWDREEPLLEFDSGCLYIADLLRSAGACVAGAFVADALRNLASFADIDLLSDTPST